MDMTQCELCKGYVALQDAKLFRVRQNELSHTDDRTWERASGIRHLCEHCIKVIQRVELR